MNFTRSNYESTHGPSGREDEQREAQGNELIDEQQDANYFSEAVAAVEKLRGIQLADGSRLTAKRDKPKRA